MMDYSAWEVDENYFVIRIGYKDIVEYGEIDLEKDIIRRMQE